MAERIERVCDKYGTAGALQVRILIGEPDPDNPLAVLRPTRKNNVDLSPRAYDLLHRRIMLALAPPGSVKFVREPKLDALAGASPESGGG